MSLHDRIKKVKGILKDPRSCPPCILCGAKSYMVGLFMPKKDSAIKGEVYALCEPCHRHSSWNGGWADRVDRALIRKQEQKT